MSGEYTYYSDGFFGFGEPGSFRPYTLMHLAPILVCIAAIVLVWLWREPLRKWKHESGLRYWLAFLMFAMEFGKEFIEYAPSTIKKTLTGSGKAGKDKVAAAVTEFTGIDHFEYDDESDACAVGITWLLKNVYQIEKRI